MKFLHALEFDQDLLGTSQSGSGSP